MKKTECIWRTSFVPSVMGDVEQETGFDDFDRVYLEHRDNIEEGVHCLATFVREHMQVDNRSEFVLTHGCQGRSTGGGRIIGYDFIDVFRGFLALIFASSSMAARTSGSVIGGLGIPFTTSVGFFSTLASPKRASAKSFFPRVLMPVLL